MAKLYTQAELCQANLPGFNSGATLSEALKPTTDWQTVLSLTLIRRDPDGSLRIQSGIRRADTNFTHPDVVSTPTGRLPRFIVGQLMAEKRVFLEDEAPWRLTEINPQEPQVVARFSGNAETLPENESVLPYIASNLLAKKLGCAASLEQSTSDIPFGSVSLATVLAGFSYASDGYDDRGNETNLFEPLLMVGAVVNVHNPSLIPRDTESYREVSWVDLDSYRKGVLGREAALLIPDIKPEDEAGVCVRGLCLVTSKAAVSGGSGIAAHLG